MEFRQKCKDWNFSIDFCNILQVFFRFDHFVNFHFDFNGSGAMETAATVASVFCYFLPKKNFRFLRTAAATGSVLSLFIWTKKNFHFSIIILASIIAVQ